jgi:hypothetical protein
MFIDCVQVGDRHGQDGHPFEFILLGFLVLERSELRLHHLMLFDTHLELQQGVLLLETEMSERFFLEDALAF